jgi:hypothetical protein
MDQTLEKFLKNYSKKGTGPYDINKQCFQVTDQ